MYCSSKFALGFDLLIQAFHLVELSHNTNRYIHCFMFTQVHLQIGWLLAGKVPFISSFVWFCSTKKDSHTFLPFANVVTDVIVRKTCSLVHVWNSWNQSQTYHWAKPAKNFPKIKQEKSCLFFFILSCTLEFILTQYTETALSSIISI